nr:hypothetical protein [Tanacetum cinerariifolium]
MKEKNRASEDMVNDMFLSPGLSHGIWGKLKDHLELMTKLSKIRDNEMIMISKMRDKINPMKKRLNLEEAKEQELRNRLDPILFFMVENEPATYREAVTFLEWLNRKKPFIVK